MPHTRTAIAIGLAVTAFALAGCGGGDEAAPADTATTDATETTEAGSKLIGSVASNDFVITLTTEDGAAVTTLTHGTFTLQSVDMTDIHNFHLTGPGVDVSSEVAGQSDEEVEIELQAGTYNFVCDPHASSMNGSFEVT